MADMTEILNMVRAGRLTEATESIQHSLRGAPEPGDRPMKDVTPKGRALPGKARPAKRTRPRRPAEPMPDGGAWLRRADGALPYRLYRPATPVAEAPLVVMLHGCTQTPEDFAAGTAMCRAADAQGAFVLFPEQTRRANANLCWNWFEPAHQGRSGEAAAIVSVVQGVLSEIGGTRSVHAAGLSAGGALAAILGAHYPDVFASVGIHSGLPVGAARDVGSAFAAMGAGAAAKVPLAVPAIVFHGMADRTVAPANGAALMPEGAARRREMQRGGRNVALSEVDVPGHAAPSELWQVEGLGHAWSGGDARGSHADPAGPDATAEMLRFFAATR